MNANTEYIQGLKYDLNALLAVDLQPSSQPAYPDREEKPGQVIVCTKIKHDVGSNLSENALLNPGTGVVYPGAVLKQDRTLAEGQPTPYTFPRAALTVRVALPGLGDRGIITIPTPTNVRVEAEIEKVVGYWLQNVKDTEGYVPPVRAFSVSHKSYTKEQIGIESGFGAQWGKNAATLSLAVQSTTEETIVYRAFRQIYYTVYIEEPVEAGDVFAESVKLDGSNMPATQPPGYVRSVDYGRIIVVQLVTTAEVTEHEAEATLDYVTIGGDISADMKEKYEKVKRSSSFKALVLGGGNEAAQLLSGDPDRIKDAIVNGIEFSRKSPAYPVSYVVADLKSRATSEIRTTTSYIETVRRVLPNRSITMKHHGGYAAKFIVTWRENDGSGKFVPKIWDSGKKTAPWDHTLTFPGDAIDFVVKGINDTWLVWDPHREKSVRYATLDGDKTVTIAGTTLNMTIGG